MRSGVLLLIVVMVAAGYYLWTQWNKPPVHAPTPVPVAPTANRLVCQACSGEGCLMLVRGHAKTDKPYACPICGGQGYINRAPPPGAPLCPDCRGMGKRLYNSSSQRLVEFPPSEKEKFVRLRGAPCKRCHGMGYVRIPPGR